MKKFLAVFDGFNLSQSTLEYAIYLTKLANANLVGVFLDEAFYRNYDIAGVIKNVPDYESAIHLLDEKDAKKRAQSVEDFERACSEAKISFTVHRDESIAQQELRHESLFADLIIINRRESFAPVREQLPTGIIRDLLKHAYCPVILAPGNFQPIENITFLYDGSSASVIAIKMFSYLFGDCLNLPIQVFTLNINQQPELPDGKFIHEYMNDHFPEAEFILAQGHSAGHILDYLRQRKDTWLIILGAYSRNKVSLLFRPSLADAIMQEISSPIFTTHER
ncbi:universal stress protein [Flavitalea antarctica]